GAGTQEALRKGQDVFRTDPHALRAGGIGGVARYSRAALRTRMRAGQMVRGVAIASGELCVAGPDCDWAGAASLRPDAKSGGADAAEFHAGGESTDSVADSTRKWRVFGGNAADEFRHDEFGGDGPLGPSGGGEGS